MGFLSAIRLIEGPLCSSESCFSRIATEVSSLSCQSVSWDPHTYVAAVAYHDDSIARVSNGRRRVLGRCGCIEAILGRQKPFHGDISICMCDRSSICCSITPTLLPTRRARHARVPIVGSRRSAKVGPGMSIIHFRNSKTKV